MPQFHQPWRLYGWDRELLQYSVPGGTATSKSTFIPVIRSGFLASPAGCGISAGCGIPAGCGLQQHPPFTPRAFYRRLRPRPRSHGGYAPCIRSRVNSTPIHGDGSGITSCLADCMPSTQPTLRVESSSCEAYNNTAPQGKPLPTSNVLDEVLSGAEREASRAVRYRTRSSLLYVRLEQTEEHIIYACLVCFDHDG